MKVSQIGILKMVFVLIFAVHSFAVHKQIWATFTCVVNEAVISDICA